MEDVIIERSYYYPGAFVARVVNGVFGLIEAALVLRLVLELLGANPSSQFIAWVYGVTDPLIGPFVGAFPGLSIGNGYAIELVIVVAMIGYAIIGWLVMKLLSFIFSSI
ncbi:MAG TPA: YggT family protein [Candidatus Paceibacterota bacterium]